MVAQPAGFPKELQKHFTDDLDILFDGILFACLILVYGFVFWIQSLPSVTMDESALQKYLEVIYQVDQQPVVVQKVEEKKKVKAKKVEEVVEETKTEKKSARRNSALQGKSSDLKCRQLPGPRVSLPLPLSWELERRQPQAELAKHSVVVALQE